MGFEGPHGGWPAAGSGNPMLWNSATRCQRHEPGGSGTGVNGIIGYFYLAAYDPDTLGVKVSPATGKAVVFDCAGAADEIQAQVPVPLGYAVFSQSGSILGYSPCTTTVSVQRTTWSRIKRGTE